MSQTFTLAHLSDVHLSPIVGFGVRHWRVKRLLGYVNWHRKRRHVHLRSVVDALTADMAQQTPDHIAVTGDLVNIGLPLEYERALDWLRSLGPPDRVTVIPGNHDIYVRLRNDPGVLRWRAYMLPHDTGAVATQGTDFPFVRRFGRIALIGINSAVLTPPIIATGRVGEGQLRKLAALLDSLGQEGLTRVVLIHHAPLPGQSPPSRALADASTFEKVLCAHGAELVLHGHNHTNTSAACAWQERTIPIIGIASASAGKTHKHEPLARYNLYRFTASTEGTQIELVGRGLERPDGPVVELERRVLGA